MCNFGWHWRRACKLTITLCAGACGQLVVEHALSKGCGGSNNRDMEDIVPKVLQSTV